MTEADVSDAVLYSETDAGVAVLTLNRPERMNAWGIDMADAFYACVDRAEAAPHVRVLVVTGGGGAFCAGAHMGSSDTIGDSLSRSGDVDISKIIGDRPVSFLTGLRKPVVAAIDGPCVGIGLVLALMCDVRFASTGTKFAAPFAKRGLVAENGISWILPRLVGWGVAMDLLLSGRTFYADEAYELRLIKEVVAPEELMKRALEYAESIALQCAPSSLAQIKQQAYRDSTGDVDEAGSRAEALMSDSLTRPDFMEGILAFFEKRKPNFPSL
ncbi:UNVERIFIED_CONTAM: enoyl-CoA hydratase [Williamsia faeni]